MPPTRTKVSNCVQAMKRKGGKANPYAICQSATGQNYMTGEPLKKKRKKKRAFDPYD